MVSYGTMGTLKPVLDCTLGDTAPPSLWSGFCLNLCRHPTALGFRVPVQNKGDDDNSVTQRQGGDEGLRSVLTAVPGT